MLEANTAVVQKERIRSAEELVRSVAPDASEDSALAWELVRACERNPADVSAQERLLAYVRAARVAFVRTLPRPEELFKMLAQLERPRAARSEVRYGDVPHPALTALAKALRAHPAVFERMRVAITQSVVDTARQRCSVDQPALRGVRRR